MSEESITKRCDACGESVTYTGHRGFREAHLGCKMAGMGAADSTHHVCPQHGTLVWVVGPYSAFRACQSRNCTAGKRGKPWRYCAPRGEYAPDRGSGRTPDSTPESNTASAIDADNSGRDRSQFGNYNTSTDTTSESEDNDVKQTDSVPQANGTPDAAAALQALMAALQPKAPPLDEHKLAAMVSAAVDAKLADTVKVTLVVEKAPDCKVEIDQPHPYLQRVIKLVNAGLPVYLWGPAGGGKTTAAMQVAKALGRESEIDTLDPSTFRSMVQGYCTPTGEPVHTSFTRCWTGGKIYIADENDNAPGHVQTLYNSALANGHAPLAWGNMPRAEGFGFIGCGNTPGLPTREFPDRKPMSAAYKDRMYYVYWPLDEHAERQWSGVGGKGKSIQQRKSREITADSWVNFVQSLREWARTNAPTLMITPRASIVGLKALQCGESPDDVADGLIFRGADNELRTKALNAVKLP